MTEEVVRSLSRGGGHPRVEREGEVAGAAVGGDRRDIIIFLCYVIWSIDFNF